MIKTEKVHSQAGDYHPYQFPSIVPATYIFDVDSEYKALCKRTDSEVSTKNMELYSEQIAYQKYHLFSSGQVYFGWTELEEYLNQVLQKVIPDSLKNDSLLHVYPARIADKNAFTFDDGTIFFNIGLLSELKDEAAVAIILGHELAHYINSDAYTTFKSNLRVMGGAQSKRVGLLINSTHNNRMMELLADSISFELCLKAGYRLNSGLNIFEQFNHENEWEKSKYSWRSLQWLIFVDEEMTKNGLTGDTLDYVFLSHPVPQYRASLLNRILASQKEPSAGKSFLVNESSFMKLADAAKHEVVYMHFMNADYKDCVEKAFNYYLRDNNSAWLYYLNESIRRLLYKNPVLKKQGFLTEDSKKEVFNKKKGILHNINALLGDTVATKLIHRQHPLFEIAYAFESYMEAFDYFSAIALSANVPESKLTKALYSYWKSETDSFNIYINSYIADSSSLFKEYASELMNGTLNNAVVNHKKEMQIYNGVLYYRLDDSRYRLSHILSKKAYNRFEPDVIRYMNNTDCNCTLIDLEDTRQKSFSDFITQSAMRDVIFSFRTKQEMDDSFNYNRPDSIYQSIYQKVNGINPDDTDVLKASKLLFIYAPETWYYFKQKNIRSIRSFSLYSSPLITSMFLMVYDYYDAVLNKSYYSYYTSNYTSSSDLKTMFQKAQKREKDAFVGKKEY
ncbi:MAG: M48 family metalloprotease [Bacteroidota bacterium]